MIRRYPNFLHMIRGFTFYILFEDILTFINTKKKKRKEMVKRQTHTQKKRNTMISDKRNMCYMKKKIII